MTPESFINKYQYVDRTLIRLDNAPVYGQALTKIPYVIQSIKLCQSKLAPAYNYYVDLLKKSHETPTKIDKYNTEIFSYGIAVDIFTIELSQFGNHSLINNLKRLTGRPVRGSSIPTSTDFISIYQTTRDILDNMSQDVTGALMDTSPHFLTEARQQQEKINDAYEFYVLSDEEELTNFKEEIMEYLAWNVKFSETMWEINKDSRNKL